MIVTKKWQWSCGWECCFQTSSSSSWLASRTTGPPRQCHRLTCFLIHLIWQILQQISSWAHLNNVSLIWQIVPPPSPASTSVAATMKPQESCCRFFSPRTLQVLKFGLNVVLYVVQEYILPRRRRSLKNTTCKCKYLLTSFFILIIT